jgi:hypothetical protein
MADREALTRESTRGSVRLYCPCCNEVERFTPGEVERLVYALAAAESDARCASNGDRIDAGCDPFSEVNCLEIMVGQSSDIEGYAETVNAWVECRRG